MLRRTFLLKRSAMLVLLGFGLLLGAASSQTESVLHSFCEHNRDGLCPDGTPPQGVILDQKGNLYGTTPIGGHDPGCSAEGDGCGVVFKLTSKGKETVLYNFCAQTNCSDGVGPNSGLIFDQKGNLYGTTNGGGAYTGGTVFKLTPKGRETVLYSFCAQNNCTDGQNPNAGLVSDPKGSLYGTTYLGGAHAGGVVFKLTPEGTQTVLYSFCAQTNCTDGANPGAELILDQKGNLYGTAQYGGSYDRCGYDYEQGCGVVFKLTPEGKETVLHSFCEQTSCTDGANPGGLIFDEKGNLYGTAGGGLYEGCVNSLGCGVVFKLTPKRKETVLYNFCAQANCADGAGPNSGPVFDQKGNLYGTTFQGGLGDGGCGYGGGGCGVVFKLTPTGKETVLYTFCAQTKCADGANPNSGPVFDHKGNLYGTTFMGGAAGPRPYSSGVVFKLTP